jgi:hypothetical protein
MSCLGLVKLTIVGLRIESLVKDASGPGHVQDSVWPMSGLVPSVLGTSTNRQRIYSGCLAVKLSLNRLVIKKWEKLFASSGEETNREAFRAEFEWDSACSGK